MNVIPFTACLAVRNITETLDFFEELGYKVVRETIASDHNVHLILDEHGKIPLFMIQPETELKNFMPALFNYPIGGCGFFYINTTNFEKTVNRIRSKIEPLLESEGGFKLFYFRDPNGYIFAINEQI